MRGEQSCLDKAGDKETMVVKIVRMNRGRQVTRSVGLTNVSTKDADFDVGQ
jgi:hypothetical protein